MITVLLTVIMTGCDYLKGGKPDAEIGIDLSQPGKVFPRHLYVDVIKNLNGPLQSGVDTASLKSALNLAAEMVAKENLVGGVGIGSDSVFLQNMNNLHKSVHSPVYYALKLFFDNQPDRVVPVTVRLNSDEGKAKRISATAGIHEKSGIVIIKLINLEDTPGRCRVVLKYKQPVKYKGEVIVLTSGSSRDGNTLREPEKVVPMTRDLKGLHNRFDYECPAHSVVIIHLRYKKGINGFVDCC